MTPIARFTDFNKKEYESGYNDGYKSGYNAAVAEIESKREVLCSKCRKVKQLYDWSGKEQK